MSIYKCDRCSERYSGLGGGDFNLTVTLICNISYYDNEVDEELNIFHELRIDEHYLTNTEYDSDTLQSRIGNGEIHNATLNSLTEYIRENINVSIVKVICGDCGNTLTATNLSERTSNPLLRTPEWARDIRTSPSISSVQRFVGVTNVFKKIHILALFFGLTSGRITRFSITNNNLRLLTINDKQNFLNAFTEFERVLNSPNARIVLRRRKNYKFAFEEDALGTVYEKVGVSEVTDDIKIKIDDFFSIPVDALEMRQETLVAPYEENLLEEATISDINTYFDTSLRYGDIDFRRFRERNSDNTADNDNFYETITPSTSISHSDFEEASATWPFATWRNRNEDEGGEE